MNSHDSRVGEGGGVGGDLVLVFRQAEGNVPENNQQNAGGAGILLNNVRGYTGVDNIGRGIRYCWKLLVVNAWNNGRNWGRVRCVK